MIVTCRQGVRSGNFRDAHYINCRRPVMMGEDVVEYNLCTVWGVKHRHDYGIYPMSEVFYQVVSFNSTRVHFEVGTSHKSLVVLQRILEFFNVRLAWLDPLWSSYYIIFLSHYWVSFHAFTSFCRSRTAPICYSMTHWTAKWCVVFSTHSVELFKFSARVVECFFLLIIILCSSVIFCVSFSITSLCRCRTTPVCSSMSTTQ